MAGMIGPTRRRGLSEISAAMLVLALTDPKCSASLESTGWTAFEVQYTYDYTVRASFSGRSTYVSSGTILAVGV